jgi:hypothetical protein
MVMDLVQTKGIQNIKMSPMLMEQVKMLLQQGALGAAGMTMTAQGGPFEGMQSGPPGGVQPNQGPTQSPMYAGGAMADSTAFQSGRAASESMRVN